MRVKGDPKGMAGMLFGPINYVNGRPENVNYISVRESKDIAPVFATKLTVVIIFSP